MRAMIAEIYVNGLLSADVPMMVGCPRYPPAPGAGEDDGCVDTVVLMSPALCSPSRGECRVQL